MAPETEAMSAATLSGLRTVVVGSGWNIFGRGLPLIVAVAVTPILINQLGIERWGLFTLALALGGMLGILDFGIGRALTRALAEAIATGREADAASLVATALALLLPLSLLGAGLGFAAVPWLVNSVLRVTPAMQAEVITAFRILAASAPLIVVNVTLHGVAAAYQRFRAVNLLAMPVSAAYFVGPALLLLLWDSLAAVMLVFVACRLAYTIVCGVIALRLVPGLRRGARPRLVFLPLLVRIGAWITLSNMLTPLLLYADRFLIAALLPLTAVAYYATPFDLVTRFTILPMAVTGSFFPAVAASYLTLPERTRALLRQTAAAVAVCCFAACLVTITGAPELLNLWLGPDFAAESGTILRLLAFGIFFGCIGLLVDALLDGTGRPDIGAKLVVLQALVFIPVSAVGILVLGIEGAALGFALRSVAGCVARVLLSGRVYPPAAGLVPNLLGIVAAGGVLLPLGMLPLPLVTRSCFAVLLLVGFAALVLRVLLEPGERGRLRQAWRAARYRGLPHSRRRAATTLPDIIAQGATRDQL
jgi:O-antigen/teichoic acid export membrane protein